MAGLNVKKGDRVKVIAGKDKGKEGEVIRALPKKDRVVVEKANMVKRHMRANPYTQQPGGIVEKEMPIHVSNVMVVCSACAQPTRVGYKYIEADGKQKKVRFCKKCNEVME